MLQRQVNHMNISDAAARRLSSGNRTCRELKDYLLKKNFDEEKINAVIAEFKDYGYLDDRRYCSEYFDYAFSRGKSKNRAFYELRTKGVAQNDIDVAYDEYEGDKSERKRAMGECLKILGNEGIEDGDPVPEKLLGRIGRNLKNKGYSIDIIYSIIGEMRK